MMVCAICGKKIFTTYPANWPYRYKSMVFCSQDCQIVHTARDLHKVDFANLWQQDMSGFYPYEIPVREGKTEEDSDIRGQRHPPVIGSRPRPKNRPMNFLPLRPRENGRVATCYDRPKQGNRK